MNKEKITLKDLTNLLLENVDKEKQSRSDLIDLLNNDNNAYAVMSRFNESYLFDNFYAHLSSSLLEELSIDGLSTKELNKRFKKYIEDKIKDTLLKSDVSSNLTHELSYIFIRNRMALSVFYSTYKRYRIVSDEDYEMDIGNAKFYKE